MAHFAYNLMRVRAKNPEQLDAFMTRISGFPSPYKSELSTIGFHHLIPIQATGQFPKSRSGDWGQDVVADVVSLKYVNDTEILYCFSTKYGSPTEVFELISEIAARDFPGLDFRIDMGNPWGYCCGYFEHLCHQDGYINVLQHGEELILKDNAEDQFDFIGPAWYVNGGGWGQYAEADSA